MLANYLEILNTHPVTILWSFVGTFVYLILVFLVLLKIFKKEVALRNITFVFLFHSLFGFGFYTFLKDRVIEPNYYRLISSMIKKSPKCIYELDIQKDNNVTYEKYAKYRKCLINNNINPKKFSVDSELGRENHPAWDKYKFQRYLSIEDRVVLSKEFHKYIYEYIKLNHPI